MTIFFAIILITLCGMLPVAMFKLVRKNPGLALVLSLLISAILISLFIYYKDYIPVAVFSEAIVFILQAIVLVAAVVLSPFTMVSILIIYREESDLSKTYTISKWLLHTLVVSIILILFRLMLSPLHLFLMVLVPMSFGYALTLIKHSNVYYIVSLLKTAMKQNLPLTVVLQNEIRYSRGDRYRILQKIQKWLTKGFSLSEAFRRGFYSCPRDVVAEITEAEKFGQLPAALNKVSEDLSRNIEKADKIQSDFSAYPLVVLSILFIITLGLMVFIVPTFAEVLYDLSEGQRSLPFATRILLNISTWFLANRGLNALLVVGVVLFIFFIRFFAIFVRRRPHKPHYLSIIGDWIKWHIPIKGRNEKNASLSRVISMLRLSIAAGVPVNEAIGSAANTDINYVLRRRLLNWKKQIEEGANVSESAINCGLGQTLAWAFNDTLHSDNVPAVLEMLESFYRANYNYVSNLIRLIFCPLTVIFIGSCVGFVVYAMFIPMIEMVVYLTETALP